MEQRIPPQRYLRLKTQWRDRVWSRIRKRQTSPWREIRLRSDGSHPEEKSDMMNDGSHFEEIMGGRWSSRGSQGSWPWPLVYPWGHDLKVIPPTTTTTTTFTVPFYDLSASPQVIMAATLMFFDLDFIKCTGLDFFQYVKDIYKYSKP